MNGGYLMVSKADTNLYEKLNNALTLGKPVLFYEDENTCYYIDSITKSGTDIILTKGGKTITIESDGDITEVGEIQAHLYSNNIYINATDSQDTSIYIFFEIVDKKILTNEEIENYIKQFTNSSYKECNGYETDNFKLIVNIFYALDKYTYTNAEDNTYTFTINNCYNKAIQII